MSLRLLKRHSKDRARPVLEAMESRELLTAALTVTQSVFQTTPVANEPVSYVIEITNTSTAGESITDGVLTDSLPDNFDFNATLSSPGLTQTGNTVVATDANPLAAGASVSLIVSGTFPFTSAGTSPVNTAVATGTDPSSNPVTSPTDVETVTIDPSVNLTISQATSVPSVNVGQAVTYTLTVSNGASLNNASNVYVTDTLPANTTFVPGSSSPGWILSGNTLIDPLGTVNSGASQNLTVVIMPTVAAQTTTLTNTASVSNLEVNTGPASGRTTTDSTVAVNPAVGVSISDSVTTPTVPGTITLGNALTYTLTVTNSGPSDAHNVVVTDTLPAGIGTNGSVISAPGGVVSVSGNMVTVTYATLPAAAGANTATITILAKAVGPFGASTTIADAANVTENEFNLASPTSTSVTTYVDVTNPQVVGVVRYGYHFYPTVIVVSFSKPMNPSTVTNLANYSLINYGNAHLPNWWLKGTAVTIGRAVYNAKTNSVYLYPTTLIPFRNTYGLSVGLVTDQVGNTLFNGPSNTLLNATNLKGLIAPPIEAPVVPAHKVVAKPKANLKK